MNLRQQKKLETTIALEEATTRLSLQRGFDAVTVDEIATEAGVSRRTFFRYFETKEAAFFDHHAARLARFEGALTRPEPGERPVDTVRRCLLQLADEYDAHSAVMAARHRCIQDSPTLLAAELRLDRGFEEAIVAALSRGSDDPTELLRARVLGSALFGVVRAILRAWFADPGSPLVELGALAFEMLSQGFEPRETR